MLCIIAEKPSQAKNFAKALGGQTGTYNGEPYAICALAGHVFSLPKNPEDLVDAPLKDYYKTWDFRTLPWDARVFQWERMVMNPGAKESLQKLKSILGESDEAVIATDNDPDSGEGELLAWEALIWAGWRGKTTRMYFADEAAKSVQKAFVSRVDLGSRQDDGDYLKALARQRFDYLSMQFSRVATLCARERGYGGIVREGRLKSYITRLVAEQQKAYEEYKKLPYFELCYKDECGVVYAVKSENAKRVATKQEIVLPPAGDIPIEDTRQEKTSAPQKLLDLMGIASKLSPRGYKPQQILDTYQAMYNEQIVSYPRTEDNFITPEQFNDLLPLVDKISKVVGVSHELLTHREPRSSFVHEGAAHGANRPGENVPDSLDALAEKFGELGAEIYSLVAKSYLAMLAEDYKYLEIKAHLQDNPDFVGTIQIPLDFGFKQILFEEEDDKDKVQVAQKLGSCAEPFIYEGANKRPQKPTIRWLKTQLEKHKVGTAATRTSTIAEISDAKDKSALLQENKSVLTLTEVGKISSILIKDTLIAEAQTTESLFAQMKLVGQKKLGIEEVLSQVADMVVNDMAIMQKNSLGIDPAQFEQNLGKCPVCSMPMKLASTNKMVYCTSRKIIRNQDTGSFEIKDPGCGYQFYTQCFSHKLTNSEIKKLLAGKSLHLANLTSKNVKGKFSGALCIDPHEKFGTRFVFDTKGKKSACKKR